MPDDNTRASIADWLRGQGYAEEEIQKILAKLADHDHQTLTDAVFDSIGGGGQTLDQIIQGILKDT